MRAAAISRSNVEDGKASKSPNRRRAEAIAKAQEDAKTVDEMMTKYDTNKSGKLEESQLALMLKDLNGGKEVTREELNWVFYKADTTTGRRNYGIDPGEVAYAVRIWKGYLDNKVYLDQTFEKYDPENKGSLDFAQLKTLLTDLTDPGNAPPTDEEVHKVLYEADRKDGEIDGGVKKVELLYAISLWYTMVKIRKPKPAKTMFPTASKMCVVM